MRYFTLFKKCLQKVILVHRRKGSTAVISEDYLLKGAWIPTIGLEVHAQIKSDSKLFCRSPVQYFAPPNSRIGIFDTAHPGTLPVLNKRCVESAALTAMAMNAFINPVSYFDRKHYFYPDLPAGYQITQKRHPFASGGSLSFLVVPSQGRTPYLKSVDLIQLQLEEDSGKTLSHPDNQRKLIDLNRAGVGLMELVFSPSLHSPEEAEALVQQLAKILRALDVCTANMNEGALRVDANISVSKSTEAFGTRTEVKNLNSLRFLREAVSYEINRQIQLLESGQEIYSDTRNYDPSTGVTASMRIKEGLHDYRYMPEPNLPPLRVFEGAVEDTSIPPFSFCLNGLRQKLPTLPNVTEKTVEILRDTCHLNASFLEFLVGDTNALEFFMELVNIYEYSPSFKKASSGIDKNKDVYKAAILLLMHCLNERREHFIESISHWPITPGTLLDCACEVQQINIKMDRAKDILDIILRTGDQRTPIQIAEANHWVVHTDVDAVRSFAREVVNDYEDYVTAYYKRRDNPKKQIRSFNKLAKEVRLRLGGGDTVDMVLVEEILREVLNEVQS